VGSNPITRSENRQVLGYTTPELLLTPYVGVVFMLYGNKLYEDRQQPHVLQDSYLDFRLFRQAMLCTEQTMAFYTKTLRKFFEWLSDKELQLHHE
jgi:hypothetical protein